MELLAPRPAVSAAKLDFWGFRLTIRLRIGLSTPLVGQNSLINITHALDPDIHTDP
jgi:hypothetical protein